MQRNTLYSILGVDAMLLSLKNLLLKGCCPSVAATYYFEQPLSHLKFDHIWDSLMELRHFSALFLNMYYFISRYKELQIANPGQMPSITLSLFQSPGGRKFITFITSFIRFVTKEFLNKVLFHSILHNLLD